VFLTLDKTAFSPNGDTADETVKITPVVPETNGIEGWALTVQDTANNTVKVFKGQATVPPSVIWDGKDNNNKKAPDGQYTMKLTIDYLSGINTESQVYPVTLDTASPSVEMTTEPELFSPDGDGEDDVLFMHLKIGDPQGVKRWKMTIFDPDKKPFKTFEGSGEPAETIQWDGRSDKGELVESAQNYKVKVYAEDNIGNRSEKEVYTVKVDVLVEKTDRGLKIRINNIEFEFGKANLQSASTPILNRVSQLLKKYGNYKVEVQGHTDNIGGEKYNLELSQRRAEAVYGYLLKKGIGAERMTTVGFGFQYPYADNATEEGRRKNRRVEFILIKNQ
jgi:outer membrane protein OmpA-like peptidoglycan-associated protein